MKIIRSTKCSLKFTTETKRRELKRILVEYGRVVNFFIDLFWSEPGEKKKLLASIVNRPETWLTARLRAAEETETSLAAADG